MRSISGSHILATGSRSPSSGMIVQKHLFLPQGFLLVAFWVLNSKRNEQGSHLLQFHTLEHRITYPIDFPGASLSLSNAHRVILKQLDCGKASHPFVSESSSLCSHL